MLYEVITRHIRSPPVDRPGRIAFAPDLSGRPAPSLDGERQHGTRLAGEDSARGERRWKRARRAVGDRRGEP